MHIKPISEWMLYRLRFVLAYGATIVLLGLLLLLFPDNIPPGMSASEQQSVVTSASVSFTQPSQHVIDLPYHILQKVSVDLLGITPFGVRLPSLILAALTVLCLILTLRRWFQANIALVAGLIIVSSAWFLTLGRLGTPLIMIPFWTSLIVLAATHISQQTKGTPLWKILFGCAVGLSLYTPYMVYLFTAAFLAAFSQPHLRFLIRQASPAGVTIGLFLFALLLVPLGWGIYNNLGIIRTLLAIPTELPEPLAYGSQLLQALSNLANPFANQTGEFITPVLGIASIVLLLFGLYRLLNDFHAIRSHLLLLWVTILVPVAAFTPHNLTAFFVPLMLINTIGLTLVIRYWYRLFPRNPYARAFGLLPLAILVFAIIQFNYERYIYGMLYSEQAGKTFQPDAFLAQAEARQIPATQHLTIVVPASSQPLYQIIANQRPNTIVINSSQAKAAPGTWIVAESQAAQTTKVLKNAPTKLLVNDRKNDALRFRVYQQ